MEIFNKKGKVKHGLRHSLWDKREESIARNGDERDPWRSTESEKIGGGVWATVEVCDWNHLLCVCVCVYQSVKGFGQSPCLRSFTKKGHITETQWTFPLATTMHVHCLTSVMYGLNLITCVFCTQRNTPACYKNTSSVSTFLFFKRSIHVRALWFSQQSGFPEKITVSYGCLPYVDCVFVRHFDLMNSCL